MTEASRIVVVTGASAGVGRAIASAFGAAGWSVGLLARGSEGLHSAKREIEAAGGRALAIELDVADAAAVQDAARQVEEEFGPIEVWVNNAMVTIYASSVDVEPDEWEQITRVSYLGQVYGALAALKYMRPRNRGTVIFIGSALAYRSIPFQAPYCAAKSAVRGFVDSLRSELMWEGSRIGLSMIQLPAVNTPQFDWARSRFTRKLAPVPPIYRPETVAAAVLRAVDRRPREYWLGGSALKAIVAQMVAPGIADRYLARAGKSSETTNQPAETPRPDNLFEAGRGDPGSHGRFDARERRHAIPFNPELFRMGAGIAVAALAGGLALRTLSGRVARPTLGKRARSRKA